MPEEVLMFNNYTHFACPQFRLLSNKQVERLHSSALQILERTGVFFECQEAIDLLAQAGADVSNPMRVKIPSSLVEQALRTVPKTITIYKRDGEVAMVLDGMTSHFGGHAALREYLDPYTGENRECYVEDIADMARLHDALLNIEWIYTIGSYTTIPGAIADKVAVLQALLHTTKPVGYCLVGASSLRDVLDVCTIIAGGEKELQAKPFLIGSSEPLNPLVQGKDAVEKSLLCAERGIPNIVYSAPILGVSSPVTFAAVLAFGMAEFLSQLVVIQLKKPGAPVLFGSLPFVMDMRTTICSYGAPESAFLLVALAEMGRYLKLPFFGRAGATDADVVDIQAATEATYQYLLSAMSGASLIHGAGEMHWGRMASPEFAVLGNEIIDMVKVMMQGIDINEETIPFDLIERIGPGGTYLAEEHTLKHFREIWVPKLFDRSMVKSKDTKRCADLIKGKTLEILRTHQPEPLAEDKLKEVQKFEANWLKQAGMDKYPKRPR
jgi:trimethylamine--corrinoid protein Co-methyltransferase